MKASTDTDNEPTKRFFSEHWSKGLIGNKPDGLGRISAIGTFWRFDARFLSSGRMYGFQGDNIEDMARRLRNEGWLPYSNAMIGGVAWSQSKTSKQR